MCGLFKIPKQSLRSAAGGEGDDFDARSRLHEGLGVVTGKNRVFIDFHDDWFAGKTKGCEQVIER
jgi:hypothetical protein